MTTLKEKVNIEIENDITYRQERIADLTKKLPHLLQVAEILERTFPETTFYGSTFTIPGRDSKEAFEITTRLLEMFPIGKFIKVFSGTGGVPGWLWEGCLVEDEVVIDFSVTNATPDPDCIPTQEIHSYKSWVCRRKEDF